MAIAIATTEQRCMAKCTVCGLRFDCSHRSARDYRAGRTEPRCILHRKRRPRAATVTAELRRYWLDRFTLDEICELAAAIFPPGTDRAATAASMTASAQGDD